VDEIGAVDRPVLRLGSRRSPLALHQAALARDAIHAVDPDQPVVIVEIVSEGDVDQRDLREIGDRGIFARELERRLAAGDIDAAVHSSKDLALEDTPGLVLAAWLEREDPRDALVGAIVDVHDLPQGARIATSSARRGSSLRTIREDLQPVPVRGNVARRIEVASERGDAGCLLAMAGLTRLGIVEQGDVEIRPLDVDLFVPEAGQGAVVIQATARVCPRTGFDWSRVDHVETRRTVQFERALAHELGGGCEQPVGVHVELAAGRIHAFAAPAPDEPGVRLRHDVMGLELGTLVSVDDAQEVDDAAVWSAQQLAPQLAEELGISQVVR
jgi:hydroxymethylbilane synthase